MITIRIKLKNSAVLESPETIRHIVKSKIDKMILDDPMLVLFVDEYFIEVQP